MPISLRKSAVFATGPCQEGRFRNQRAVPAITPGLPSESPSHLQAECPS
jgi:hypothetical protein